MFAKIFKSQSRGVAETAIGGPPSVPRLMPHKKKENKRTPAFERALALFRSAAKDVPAYKDFLKKNGVHPDGVQSPEDFQKVPTISKENYFSKYSPDDLSWNGEFNTAQYISTSSGSSGKPFVWPRGEIHKNISGQTFQRLYEDIFDTKHGSTLFIISFAFGQWIAGFEFCNAVEWTRVRGSQISLVTSGIEAEDVVNKVRDFGKYYDRIVIAGYPPFIKDILELGARSGVVWREQNLFLNTAGEPYSEKWRESILKKIGITDVTRRLINVFGMSETGIVAHETPRSILLRKHMEAQPTSVPEGLGAQDITSVFQYYPTARYFEVHDDHSLLLTSNASFPLIRYETRDLGGILSTDDVPEIPSLLEKYGRGIAPYDNDHSWQLPFVYLFGRRDFSVSFYALNIYTENIKMALEDADLTDELSGLFSMRVNNNSRMNQRLDIEVELNKDQVPNSALEETVRNAIVNGLRKYNSEYAKLHQMIKKRAVPNVKLAPHGSLPTIRGKKHKWVKRA